MSPCYDDRSRLDAEAYHETKKRLDQVTAFLCTTLARVMVHGHEHLYIGLDHPLRDWWTAHLEADRRLHQKLLCCPGCDNCVPSDELHTISFTSDGLAGPATTIRICERCVRKFTEQP